MSPPGYFLLKALDSPTSGAFKSVPFSDGLLYLNPMLTLGSGVNKVDYLEQTDRTSATEVAVIRRDLLNADGTFHSQSSVSSHTLSDGFWVTGIQRDELPAGNVSAPQFPHARLRVYSDGGETQLRMAASTHPDGLAGLVFADGSTY